MIYGISGNYSLLAPLRLWLPLVYGMATSFGRSPRQAPHTGRSLQSWPEGCWAQLGSMLGKLGYVGLYRVHIMLCILGYVGFHRVRMMLCILGYVGLYRVHIMLCIWGYVGLYRVHIGAI